MRRTASLLIGIALAAPLIAQTKLTVRQFEHFLLSPGARKESDAVLARQLARFQLSEQLTHSRLAELASQLRIGPQTAEQIRLIAAASVFQAPPPSEQQPAPDSSQQARILQAAREYVVSFARRLPDFLALRSTQSYDNAPQYPDRKHSKHSRPVILIHFVGARHRQVAVRGGLEVSTSTADSGTSDSDHADGMTTWGEFGPLLTTVLGDVQAGSVAWSRWQTGPDGARLAVFRYSVPRSASHDVVDLWNSALNRSPVRSFSDKPDYQGDLYIEPATGVIRRITLEAQLPPQSPILISRLAVDYAPVEIGGKTYTCPVRAIAVSVAHNAQMESIEGGGPERFINLVSFTGYRKFGSTARILDNK